MAWYTHPVVEKILDEKRDKTYRGLFLENQYLKIMILPELGGRVRMAYDKIRKRQFVLILSILPKGIATHLDLVR